MLSDEELAKKLQDEELNEIIIIDKSASEQIKHPLALEINENNARFESQPNQQNFAPAVYDPTQLNQQIFAPAVNDSVPVDPDYIKKDKFLRTIRFSNWMKIFCLIEFFLIFVYILTGIFPLVLLVVLPLLGYLAQKKLSSVLLAIYMVSLAIVSILRIVLIVIANNIAFTILTVIIIIITIPYLMFLYKFSRLLTDLTSSEKNEIFEMLKNDWKYKICGWF